MTSPRVSLRIQPEDRDECSVVDDLNVVDPIESMSTRVLRAGEVLTSAMVLANQYQDSQSERWHFQRMAQARYRQLK
jgi:hypothetical protein